MELKGIIFDFNGVLWWDREHQEESWKNFSAKLRGYPMTDDEMQKIMHGRTNKEIDEYLLNRKLTNEEAKKFSEEKEIVYREICLNLGSNFKLSPGAIDLLDKIVKLNVPHTIATASEIGNLTFFFQHLNLNNWFDINHVVYDDGTFPGKPAPDIYLKAAKLLNLQPENCIVIEDAISGIEAAFRAGIGWIIGLGPKAKHGQLKALNGVKETIENLGEVKIEHLIQE